MGQDGKHGLTELAAGRLAIVPPLQGCGVQAVVVLWDDHLRQLRSVAVEVGALVLSRLLRLYNFVYYWSSICAAVLPFVDVGCPDAFCFCLSLCCIYGVML